jgi:hypothetical protein
VSVIPWDDGPEATRLEGVLSDPRFVAASEDRQLCPCCRGLEIHVFFNRHRADRGGGWVWCSRCRRYLHATVQVPSWWQNMQSIPEDILTAVPKGLDKFSDDIDEHLARLMARIGVDDKS